MGIEVDGNGDDAYLLRRQPHRERAREVLNQNGDKALEGPTHGAMNDHGAMGRVVLAGIRKVKTLRRVVVELNGAELPRPTNGVGDIEVDLGAVKRPVAFLHLVASPCGLECGPQTRFGAIPEFVTADPLFRTRGELERRREPKGVVVTEDELEKEADFARDLVLAQEHMTVVLGELAYACESRERPGNLVAVQHIEGDEPYRQFAI